MKRGRPPRAAPAACGIAPALYELAKGTLEEHYVAFLAGTSAEDPKLFIARSAAARETLAHLAQLETMAGPGFEPPPEPSNDDVLASARADMAHENKS